MSFQRNALGVRVFGGLVRLINGLNQAVAQLTPPPFRLLQIGSAFWQSRALYVAARLDLATALGDQSLAIDVLAARVGSDARSTGRLLRLLAALGVFRETRPGVFANNRVSNHLRDGHAGSVRPLVLMHNAEAMSLPWYAQLEQGVRSGKVPFELAHGQDLYAYMDSHPALDELFSEAMASVERVGGDGFAQDFDWGRFERVIDVGGGVGSKAVAILKRHRHLRALVVDRKRLVSAAPAKWAASAEPEILERLEFQAGDLFDPLPPARGAKDVYLFSAVFHGLEDEACIELLRHVRERCADSGARAAVMELIPDECDPDIASASVDMQMLMGTPGRLRPIGEWRALCGQCGLEVEERVGLRSPASILVLRAI